MRHRPHRLPGSARGRHHRDLRRTGNPAHVGVLRVELHVPLSHSLKEKRAAIKPIIEGAKRRFGVAAAEVDHQNTWQRADLGVAAVAAAVSHVEEVLDEVERFVWSHPNVEVLAVHRSWADLDT